MVNVQRMPVAPFTSHRRLPRRQQVATTRQEITGLGRRYALEELQIDLLCQRKAAAGDGTHERYALRKRHDLLSAAMASSY